MKPEEELLDALGEVGMDLVDLAEKVRFPKALWRRVLPTAACAAVILFAGLFAGQSMTTPETALSADTPDVRYSLVVLQESRVLLSSWSSEIDSDDPRSVNVSLACQAMDGLILEPGEEFSFNDTVGERTAEKGYVAASIFDNGTGEIGGGIGQAASTLYCAALELNLEQLERAGNTYAVDYVPMGLDAAVYWGITDYRFRNSLNHAVEIKASVAEGLVTVELWGEAEDAVSVELESVTVEETIAETFQNFLDEDGNVTERRSLGITVYEPLPE